MMAVFECRAVGGTLKADGEEIADARYFSAAELATITLSRWARIIVPQMTTTRGAWLPPVTWRPT